MQKDIKIVLEIIWYLVSGPAGCGSCALHQILALVYRKSRLVLDSSILHCFRIYFERCTVL